MSLLIKGGRVINPATKTDEELDILVDETTGKITRIAPEILDHKARVIDAAEKIVFPGFIDMHVHMRDPGQTYKGDIRTESKAAARGGYTTVCAMPNTTPVVDSAEGIRYVRDKAKSVGLCNVLQVGAITKGMEGKELSDIYGMANEGMICISEDGKSVMDSGLLRKAMKIAKEKNLTVLSHCEDINLVEGGVMNAGEKSKEFGVNGITNAVENVIIARDIMLAEETGARLHLCHCSTKESAELIRDAKAKGIFVSGEVCPHHFALSEEDIPSKEDANYKMNPPLRAKEDVEALKQGLKDGVFEVISTDHAPHSAEEKAKDFEHAPFGIVGMETAASLTYSELVLGGYLSLMQMAEKLSYNPARILGIDAGDLSAGKPADITIFDPDKEYEVNKKDFAGKSTNMPYEGWTLTGQVVTTIKAGKVTYEQNQRGNSQNGLQKVIKTITDKLKK